MIAWITFRDHDHRHVCVVTKDNDHERVVSIAQEIEKKFVDEVFSLPYPASPCIFNEIEFPTFCHDGDVCKGRSSCPRSYACSE